MEIKTIGFASDHAGFALKNTLLNYMVAKGYVCHDSGTYWEESCDYPDYAHLLARAVEGAQVDRGIALCGTGNGIAMALNKHQGIRAAISWNEEMARLVRAHNDANILVLPARFISSDEAKTMVDIFFSTSFDGGRQQRRIDKIPEPF